MTKDEKPTSEKRGLFKRLKKGLSKTRSTLSGRLDRLFLGKKEITEELLEDLELVLIQIVVVANTPEGDQARIQSELNLALEGLETREVLPRIQAVIPAGPGFYGT